MDIDFIREVRESGEFSAVGLIPDPLEGLTERDFEALETFFS